MTACKPKRMFKLLMMLNCCSCKTLFSHHMGGQLHNSNLNEGRYTNIQTAEVRIRPIGP